MNRLAHRLTVFLTAGAVVGTAGVAAASPAGDPGVATGGTGKISRLVIRVDEKRVPATGMTPMRIGIRNANDVAVENVRLVIRTSNRRVPTARKITYRRVGPESNFWSGRIGITPGPKARGKTTITVSGEGLEASATIFVTPPTPDAEDWKDPPRFPR